MTLGTQEGLQGFFHLHTCNACTLFSDQHSVVHCPVDLEKSAHISPPLSESLESKGPGVETLQIPSVGKNIYLNSVACDLVLALKWNNKVLKFALFAVWSCSLVDLVIDAHMTSPPETPGI